jgi:hypothetical protein
MFYEVQQLMNIITQHTITYKASNTASQLHNSSTRKGIKSKDSKKATRQGLQLFYGFIREHSQPGPESSTR